MFLRRMCLFVLFIICLLNVTGGLRIKRDSVVVNDLADPIIEKFRQNIIANNKNVIPVEDFEKTSTFNLYGKKIDLLTFKGQNGTIRDLSTVYRIGDITLQHFDSPGLTLNFRFGLRYLEYSCDTYLLKFPLIGFSGNLVVNVDTNEIDFKVTVRHEGEKCYFEVNHIKVVKLEGLKVRLTGFSILNKLMNKVVGWVLKSFRETIEKQIENEILGAFITTIEDSGSCRSQSFSLT